MRTSRAVLGDLEPDDRTLLLAVAAAAAALDAVRLPVVGARVVEPEPREVVEGLLGLEGALALLGLQDRGLLADHALLVLLRGLADVHEHAGAGIVDPHPERRGLAGGDGGPGLRGERRDPVLGGRRRGGGEGQRREGAERERPCDAWGTEHPRNVAAMMRAMGRIFVTRAL